ncbi:MAG: UDP-N-acetylglucosamine 2-epimerase [Planctomycetia bacterium]
MQEEAATLGHRLLVARNETEWPEALETGWVELVGTDPAAIARAAAAALDCPRAVGDVPNPFGDGRAAGRIADEIERRFGRGRTSVGGL